MCTHLDTMPMTFMARGRQTMSATSKNNPSGRFPSCCFTSSQMTSTADNAAQSKNSEYMTRSPWK